MAEPSNPNPPQQSTISLHLTPTEGTGARIGRYKLLEQIGEGGCGVVYVAQQEEPVRRVVALKVIKLGMDTRQVIARFEAERQALALMDHPNIAKVLDGGSTQTGRPFFVMELVKGVRITDYCDRNNLSTTQRLNLFIQVCQAIQHAHQKGIIHRDIKPSNVLVALRDGVAVPKVIDFGIAKATTGQQLTAKTVHTAIDQFIGTPAYMSPEQAELTGLDIDTRSDIYALGVLLYELLTGKTPFDSKRLFEAGLDEVRRIIREEEPPRPSTCISTLNAQEQTALARRHASEPPKVLGIIRGDLDWIVMKTLEKDRNRRYETANGLALDVGRFLNSEPVAARPPNSLYRFRKLVRRNKITFAAGTLVALALLLGMGVSAYLFSQEKRAREAADAAKSEALSARDAETLQRRRAENQTRRVRETAIETRVALALRDPTLARQFTAGDQSEQLMDALHRAQKARSLVEEVQRAWILQKQGNTAAADTMVQAALAAATTLWIDDPGRSEASICILADELERSQRFTEVEQLLGTFLKPQNLPALELAGLLQWRARFQARRGRWSEAVTDFGHLTRLDPDEPDNWWVVARILAHLGDLDGYRKHCDLMLARFAKTLDPATAERTAKACCFLSLPTNLVQSASELADRGLKDETSQTFQDSSYYEIAKGLTEYRLADWQSSAKWFRAAIATAPSDDARAQARFGLAMAQCHMNATSDAADSFVAGLQTAGPAASRIENGNPGLGWYNLLGTYVLMREAAKLVRPGGQRVTFSGTATGDLELVESYAFAGGFFGKLQGSNQWMKGKTKWFPEFYFDEIARNAKVITLRDPQRELRIELPIEGGMSRTSTDEGLTWNLLAEVTNTSPLIKTPAHPQ